MSNQKGKLVTDNQLKELIEKITNQPERISNEKAHYESLLSFFKNLVWVLGFLIVAGIYFIGSSLNEVEQNINQEMDNLKFKIAELEKNAEKSIERTNQDAKEEVNKLRQDASDVIQFTKDITSTQLRFIKEDVKNLAISTSRNRVEEAFQNNRINNLIESMVKDTLGQRLESLVREKQEELIVAFDYIPTITTAYDQIRQGSRSHFDQLDTLAYFNEYPIVNEISKKLLLQKGRDYYNDIFEYDPIVNLFGIDTTRRPYRNVSIDTRLINDVPLYTTVKTMLDTITYSQDLYNVCGGFIIINQKLGIDIKPFDMKTVRILKREYE